MEDKSSALMFDLMNTSVCGYIFTFLLGVGGVLFQTCELFYIFYNHYCDFNSLIMDIDHPTQGLEKEKWEKGGKKKDACLLDCK